MIVCLVASSYSKVTSFFIKSKGKVLLESKYLAMCNNVSLNGKTEQRSLLPQFRIKYNDSMMMHLWKRQ